MPLALGESWEDYFERLRRERETDPKYLRLEAIRARARREIRLCLLRAPSVRGLTPAETARRRLCFLDGKPLPPGRSRWCGPRCVRVYWRNHGWSDARLFCRLRARLGDDVAIAGVVPRGAWSIRPKCARCRKEVGEIEVNHRHPRNGEGYEEGCAHHQANLEPLCHECHVAETTRQIRERRGLPPPADNLPLGL